MANKRFLGSPDAAADDRFRDHFVPQDELSILLEPTSHVILGAKGVGKTALRRALSELNKHSFYATGTIDLDTLSFERVHLELAKLSAATGAEIITLARATWRNVLIFYCLDIVKNRLPENFPIYDRIQELLRTERFDNRNAPDRIFNQVSNFFLRLGDLGLEDPTKPDGKADEKRRMAIDRLPASPELGDLLVYASEAVAESRKSVVVCIDGFDSIVEHRPESRKAIFAGLMDAIFRLSRDRALSRSFCFKAFLPKELTHEARAVVWDADKHLHATRSLHWNEDALKEFIAKRLVQHLRGPRRSDQTFEAAWPEFMPLNIRNHTHNADENTFFYILRHTQFRPRQLLFQIQSILDAWDRKSDAFRVDGSFIPRIVANSSRSLAEVTVQQLEYARPGLESFLRSWGGLSSTIPFVDCFSKIKRIFSAEDNVQVRQLFDELFDFGVFGVGRRDSLTKGGGVGKFRFSYVGDGVVTRLQPADDDIIALCPMFSEYFACLPSTYGIVTPVSV